MYREIAAATIIGALILSFIIYEKKDNNLKNVAAIATLSAIAAGLRVIMAPLPNIMPTTFLVALTGFVFGPFNGFITGALSAFLSNIFLGQGPWTFFQMFGWGVIGLISAFLPKNIKALAFSVICFFYGFLFDYITELWYILGFVKEISLASVTALIASGFLFDMLHGSANFFFSIVFYSRMKKVFLRYKDKLNIQEIIKEDNYGGKI